MAGSTTTSILLSDMAKHVKKIQQTSETKELRHLQRAIRYAFSQFRKRREPIVLKQLIEMFIPSDNEFYNDLISYIEPDITEKMVVDENSDESPGEKQEQPKTTPPTSVTPEVEIFLILLVVVHLVDHKRYEDATVLSTRLIERLETFNRRTLDPLSSKVYFFYSRSHELVGKLESIRPKLLALQRTATLRHNFDGQITLLNLLLRNYLHYNLYDLASKLAEKTKIKESNCSSNELARYYYYLGRIKSVQMKYQEAYNDLQQAMRKAPTSTARGFRTAVIKLASVVQLLLGEIPEKSIFTQSGISHALRPYMNLVASVRRGNLAEFQRYVDENASLFQKDKTYSLIQRMRNTVIMTGLRKINAAYSTITFLDINEKLKLDTVFDAEMIVSKAIRDGIIDAKVNGQHGYIESNEKFDVYSSSEPQRQFNRRIQQFLDIHNESVKSMRYKPESSSKEIDEEFKMKLKEESELVNSLVEEDDEDDDFF